MPAGFLGFADVELESACLRPHEGEETIAKALEAKSSSIQTGARTTTEGPRRARTEERDRPSRIEGVSAVVFDAIGFVVTFDARGDIDSRALIACGEREEARTILGDVTRRNPHLAVLVARVHSVAPAEGELSSLTG